LGELILAANYTRSLHYSQRKLVPAAIRPGLLAIPINSFCVRLATRPSTGDSSSENRRQTGRNRSPAPHFRPIRPPRRAHQPQAVTILDSHPESGVIRGNNRSRDNLQRSIITTQLGLLEAWQNIQQRTKKILQ